MLTITKKKCKMLSVCVCVYKNALSNCKNAISAKCVVKTIENEGGKKKYCRQQSQSLTISLSRGRDTKQGKQVSKWSCCYYLLLLM